MALLNERLVDTKADEPDNLFITNMELLKTESDLYLFLDEIQNIKYLDKWVIKIYNMEKYYIVIICPSSKLLSSEISTSLAGRNITYIIYPFSFKQYLKAHDVP